MKKITLFSLLVIIALTMSSLYLIPHKEEITLYNEIPFPTAEFQELSPEEEISSTSEVEEFLVKESTFSEISEETQDDEKSASLDTTISLIEDNEPSEVIQIPNIELFAGSTDIQLTAEITTANQTVIVNKYFANTHSIDR
ncbi:MAG: hypothetical protein LBI53_03640 [Candidatus Peribacteria bacterium]|jgi:hypothetical protein|nr:hypothetical protein [Candidatus Peribacteria bacterium]